ncbi:hypothetical protein HYV44_02165 [Candidatus Microgenomates bacterium]|nr:hypothetical protein [Candidatus Microgenomates bacterium]
MSDNQQKITDLKQATLFTVSYFDAFGQPLTSFEVWNYLFRHQADLSEVIIVLEELRTEKKIEMTNGFYFLPNRKNILELREKRYEISEKYWEKALFATKILSFCPFIKMVAANNSLALFTCDQQSDIDFFIITTKNHIWFARGFSSLLLHLLLIRRHGKRISGKICLSIYANEDAMDLSYIAPKNREFFLSYWIAENAPIINKDQTFEKYKEVNSWIKKDLPNAQNNITNYYKDFTISKLALIISRFLEIFFAPKFWEDLARFTEKKLIKNSQKKFGHPESVIFSDQILKFHTKDWKRVTDGNWESYL